MVDGREFYTHHGICVNITVDVHRLLKGCANHCGLGFAHWSIYTGNSKVARLE